jgi:hypothetical protein
MEFRQEGVVLVARVCASLQDTGRPVPTAIQFHFRVALSLSAVGGPDSAIVVNEIESCADGAFRKPRHRRSSGIPEAQSTIEL